jgi:Conjugative transposon protein TcpC
VVEAATKTSARTSGRGARIRISVRYGRLRARLPRYAFLAFTCVMCVAGVRSVIAPASSVPPSPATGPPLDYAEQSFATGFARAYLTFDAARPEAREAALAPFVSSALEGGAGFTPPGSGSQRVQWTDVSQVQRPLAGGTIVTVAAKLSTEAEPVYLCVPLARARGGGIFISGYPSFVGPPLTSNRTFVEPAREEVSDGEVSTLVKRSLTNYLAGDASNLAADLAVAAQVTLPSNHLRLTGVEQLEWVKGVGSGAVLATVGAVDLNGGEYTLRYEVGIRRVQASDPRIAPGWRVTYVQTISQET